MRCVTALCGGTDGEDGPTDAAGAIIDSGTPEARGRAWIEIGAHLQDHDAYPFFQGTGDLVLSGQTGTNVMDVRIVLIYARSAS